MQYSNTTTKDGMLQDCEFWTGLGDGVITGDATLKALFTALLNREHDRVLSRLHTKSRHGQHDDTNYDNHPFSTFTLNAGQHDYQFLVTEDNETITDITAVLIPKQSGSSEYVSLDRLTLDNSEAAKVMSPDTTNTGTPTGYIERNNTVFLNKIPDFSGTGKLFFKRVASYFTTADTTKEPGFDKDFHRILSLGASKNWLLVNKGNETNLINNVSLLLQGMETDLFASQELRNPTKRRITGSPLNAH